MKYLKIMLFAAILPALLLSCGDDGTSDPGDDNNNNDKFTTVDFSQSSLMAAGKTVMKEDKIFFFGTDLIETFNVICFNTAKEEVWTSADIEKEGDYLCVLPNGNIFATAEQYYYIINPENGNFIYEGKYVDQITGYASFKTGAPAVSADGKIYVAARYYKNADEEYVPATLFILNSDGNIENTTVFSDEKGDPENTVIDGQNVYLTYTGEDEYGMPVPYFVSFDMNGNEIARRELPDFFAPKIVAVTNSNSFYISAKKDETQILANLSSDGSVIFDKEIPDYINSSFVADGTDNIIFGCSDGKIYSYSSIGSKNWEADFGMFATGDMILADNGKIYYIQQSIDVIDAASGVIEDTDDFDGIYISAAAATLMIKDGLLMLPGNGEIHYMNLENNANIDTQAAWPLPFGDIHSTNRK